MADKNTDKPEFHTPKAKFSKAAKAVTEPAGEFLGHWGRNATLRGKNSRSSGMSGFTTANAAVILLATTGSIGYAVITDKDPMIDQTLPHQILSLSQDGGLSGGSASIIAQNGQYFGLVKQNGYYQLYSIDAEKDVWTMIEDPANAARFIASVSDALQTHVTLKERDFTYNGFPTTYAPSSVSIPYAADGDIRRFGDITPNTVSAENAYAHYFLANAFWKEASLSLAPERYGLGDATPVQYDETYEMSDNLFGNYGNNYVFGWMTLLAGGGLLALGQTGAGMVRRRRERKNTPR